MSDQVRNPEGRFSHNEAHISLLPANSDQTCSARLKVLVEKVEDEQWPGAGIIRTEMLPSKQR